MNDKLEKILEFHQDDNEQQEVINSNKVRLIIEAPAGYGKTKTMISQIAYLITSGKLPNPKKILALTFSVNAAYKIRKDMVSSAFEGFPPHYLKNKVFASNYHGFCRRVLSIYGYVIDDKLNDLKELVSIDDSDIESLQSSINGLDYETAQFLSDFSEAVKEINTEFIKQKFNKYNSIVRNYLLNLNYITFNSILTFTIELFLKQKNLRSFYRKLYPIIIVDEFQDTNILSWYLLNILVSNETKLYLYGDSLQRIYGFIGAIPDLLNKAQKKFKTDKIELKTNYRFKNNKEMLVLDRNIRSIAKDITFEPNDHAKFTFYLANDQTEEAEIVCNLCNDLLNQNIEKRIAILVRQRSRNVNQIIEMFKEKQIDFFYGLFSDEDKDYIEFHKIALRSFLNFLKTKRLSKNLLSNIIKSINNEEKYKKLNDEMKRALIELLQTYWYKVVFGEFNFFERDEKIELIRDALENNSLKQYLGYTDHRVVITTVHGAKGLEWDYVILPDMEQYSFPNARDLCNFCNYRKSCQADWRNMPSDKFYNELSVFYVAVTRAKIKNIFTASRKRIFSNGLEREANVSCFLNLPGIKLIRDI